MVFCYRERSRKDKELPKYKRERFIVKSISVNLPPKITENIYLLK
jgi:hypothetical protein